jgi:hypothetical protein
MAINSISPNQPVQSTQSIKKVEVAERHKQSDIRDANKEKDRKEGVERQAQLQQTQERNKPAVNTSGQKIGTRINVSA